MTERHMRFLVSMLLSVVVVGCASGPQANPQDPFEPFNRRVDAFNQAIDKAALKPIAETYVEATPQVVQTGVSNFFNNLEDAWSTVNAALQLRPKEAVSNGARVLVNSTVGVVGLIDWATPMGIPRSKHDLGQTLGRWGAPMGPYVVLPLLGPSTLRDTAGLVLISGNPALAQVDDVSTRNTLRVVGALDARASLLQATNALDSIALDKYSFTRTVFLKRRELATQSMFSDPPKADQADSDDPADW